MASNHKKIRSNETVASSMVFGGKPVCTRYVLVERNCMHSWANHSMNYLTYKGNCAFYPFNCDIRIFNSSTTFF